MSIASRLKLAATPPQPCAWMTVGSGFPASDLSENSSACSLTPSLTMLAVRKSILSGALNSAAGAGPSLAGSGGRVEGACVGVCCGACRTVATPLAPSAEIIAEQIMNLTTDLWVSKIHLLEWGGCCRVVAVLL